MHLIDCKSIPTGSKNCVAMINSSPFVPLQRGNFTHRLGFKPDPMCFKCGWIIHFNGLSFPKFHSCPKSPRPDESGKLHEAQSTAIKLKQRPTEARFG
jgi:hypothetical protein